MPQLKIIEIFHTPVSLVVDAIVLKARHAMTIGHCIAQLGLPGWDSGGTDSLPAGPGQIPGGNQGQSPRKTPEILHYMIPKIAQRTTSAFHFLLCF